MDANALLIVRYIGHTQRAFCYTSASVITQSVCDTHWTVSTHSTMMLALHTHT